jgi:hypothetical protein
MASSSESTRAEHMAWCKRRALEYVNVGDGRNAITSMMSDLGKHPETAKFQEISLILMMGVDYRNMDSVRRFIEGFN